MKNRSCRLALGLSVRLHPGVRSGRSRRPVAAPRAWRAVPWPDGGRMIPFNPDQGGLGPLTNAEAVAQTSAAFQAWANVASATATHVNRGHAAGRRGRDELHAVPVASRTGRTERDRLRRGRRHLRPALRTGGRSARFCRAGIRQHGDRRHHRRRFLHERRRAAREPTRSPSRSSSPSRCTNMVTTRTSRTRL